MVFNRVHAADVARAHGHNQLADWMKDLWKRVYAHRGYDRYNQHQAQKARWMIRRDRLGKERYNFERAAVSGKERAVLDWLLVGSTAAGLCNIDVFSVVLEYWPDERGDDGEELVDDESDGTDESSGDY